MRRQNLKIEQDRLALLIYNTLPDEKTRIKRLASDAISQGVGHYSNRYNNEEGYSEMDIFIRKNVNRGRWSAITWPLSVEILRQKKIRYGRRAHRLSIERQPLSRRLRNRHYLATYRKRRVQARMGTEMERFGYPLWVSRYKNHWVYLLSVQGNSDWTCRVVFEVEKGKVFLVSEAPDAQSAKEEICRIGALINLR